MPNARSRRPRIVSASIALFVPAVALAGCPGLLAIGPGSGASPGPSPTATASSTASPTPTASPSASPTPVATPAPGRLILLDFELNPTTPHYFKVRNIGGTDVDITDYAISYQAPGSTSPLHRRLNENRSVLKKIAGLESKRINASEEGTSSAQIWFLGKDSALGGPTVGTSIGMQTSGGALALFRDADDDDDFVKSKLVDYVQWGQAPSTAYSMESVAVAAGLWKAGTYVQGTSPGKEMNPITKGATGSENWKVTDQDDD